MSSFDGLQLQKSLDCIPMAIGQGSETGVLISVSLFMEFFRIVMKYVSLAANFHSGAHFPSSYQLDYVASFVSPVSSEIELWLFERDAVENAVQSLY
ncbi:hypothetical protein DL771_010832 [Monosporascus sp. 5C6A]|nr:hypothetical protein DL771_010832 [Monosporascus sp. 5C6A]